MSSCLEVFEKLGQERDVDFWSIQKQLPVFIIIAAYIVQCHKQPISLIRRPNSAQNTGEHYHFLEGIGTKARDDIVCSLRRNSSLLEQHMKYTARGDVFVRRLVYGSGHVTMSVLLPAIRLGLSSPLAHLFSQGYYTDRNSTLSRFSRHG